MAKVTTFLTANVHMFIIQQNTNIWPFPIVEKWI